MRARANTATLFLAGALVLASAAPARADDSSSMAVATVLFDEGIALMDAGRSAEACPKLARSQELAPSGGTLLALGECYEKIGRTASAWTAFREAATRAASAKRKDAEANALERARRLEPTLARLTLTIPAAARVSGLEIRRDGAIVKDAELGVAIPGDPGLHRIEATAPNRRPFASSVDLRPGVTIDFPIPSLYAEPPPPSGVVNHEPVDGYAPPAVSASDGSTRRAVGLVVGGAGVASLVVGGVFGLLAKSKNDEALKPENCPDATHCHANGLTLTDQARSRAIISTVLVALGATALTVGGVLFFTAPTGTATAKLEPRARRVVVLPSVGWGGAFATGGTATVLW